MRLVHGNSRLVILCGNLAFKIVHPKIFVWFLKYWFRGIMHGNWNPFTMTTTMTRYYIWLAFFQNWSEYHCWRRCQAPFLAPVYISIGILNIQKWIKGVHPTSEEVTTLYAKIGRATNSECWTMDKHNFSHKNYIKTSSNTIIIIDYGDTSNKPLRFTDYLVKWQHQLAAIFLRK